MEVNIKQATKMFFSKSSFEMIFFEAFANALDANAMSFDIDIFIDDRSEIQDLKLVITDNGDGFNDVRFSKFGKLFETEETDHKGLGRLVYLCYFDTVKVESIFENTHRRTFVFDEGFDGSSREELIDSSPNGTVITLTGFNGSKLGKNDYISPSYIKNTLLEKFFMKFYRAKANGTPITVNIALHEKGISKEESITSNDLPSFKMATLDYKLDLFSKLDLYYSVKQNDSYQSGKVITAIAVDDRSYPVDVIANENFPPNYEMIFLLMSESFRGEVDGSRQNITIESVKLKSIIDVFRKGIADVIKREFPAINKQNEQRVQFLNDKYPHLMGYFETETIGYSSYQDVLKKAQDQFFREQRSILEASNLSDEDYDRALVLSSRVLAEYILFRQHIINKLKQLSSDNTEYELHNLIAPRHRVFSADNLVNDIYRNNVWVVDDKFMSYATLLSDVEMSRVIEILTNGDDEINDKDRPDITLFFSGDPKDPETMVDVVVVELKRLGLTPEVNSIVEFQLETRAQSLSKYFNNRIQRMWFYGIVEFNEKYRTHLINQDFKPLYSAGTVYFRSKRVYTNSEMNEANSIIQNAYILDIKALIEDANNRNSSFMKILKSHFAQEAIEK